MKSHDFLVFILSFFFFFFFFGIFKLFDHLKKQTKQRNNYDSDPLSFKWKKQMTSNLFLLLYILGD